MYRRLAFLASVGGFAWVVACSQADPEITAAVKSRLAATESLRAYRIDVGTSSRVVTLNGTVASEAAKREAVRVARNTEGVRDVTDQLTIDPQIATTSGELTDDPRPTAKDADANGTAPGAITKAEQLIEHPQTAITDAAITAAVKTKLLADPAVSGLKISVDTATGIVTLTGKVSTRAAATRAETLAQETNGVRQVVSRLEIGRQD